MCLKASIPAPAAIAIRMARAVRANLMDRNPGVPVARVLAVVALPARAARAVLRAVKAASSTAIRVARVDRVRLAARGSGPRVPMGILAMHRASRPTTPTQAAAPIPGTSRAVRVPVVRMPVPARVAGPLVARVLAARRVRAARVVHVPVADAARRAAIANR